MTERRIIVVGGGIAGTSCVECLLEQVKQQPNKCLFTHILLISETRLVKRAKDYQITGRHIESFQVQVIDADHLSHESSEDFSYTVIEASVEHIDYRKRSVVYREFHTSNINVIEFDVLCLCIGARPKLLKYHGASKAINDKIITLRDTSSIEHMRQRLISCKRLVIAGNGGIGLELVHKITNCSKTWIIRDKYIGSPYFDSGAAKFLLETLHEYPQNSNPDDHAASGDSALTFSNPTTFGPSLGPHWCKNSLKGQAGDEFEILYDDEVEAIELGARDTLVIQTQKKKKIECDMIISAIGVKPNSIAIYGGEFQLDTSNGAIIVDHEMRTSLDSVYAAGDCVSCSKWEKNELWFQMPLWTQARQMGDYMAKCIISHICHEDPSIYFNFECFTHCTSFFGFKLILLGRYNGQGGDEADKLDVIVRVNAGVDYVKVILKDGKIVGALLIGDSGLEETIENLICDQIDVTAFKDNLLDNTIDIEDYFD